MRSEYDQENGRESYQYFARLNINNAQFNLPSSILIANKKNNTLEISFTLDFDFTVQKVSI